MGKLKRYIIRFLMRSDTLYSTRYSIDSIELQCHFRLHFAAWALQ